MTQADAVTADVAGLMARYSFDLEGYTLDRWIDQWLCQYPKEWIHRAVIEALYQGRYKAISVWQILDLWRRRGRPLQHFNRDFERMISGQSFQLLFHPSEHYPSESQLRPSPILVGAQVNGSPGYEAWQQLDVAKFTQASVFDRANSAIILPAASEAPQQPVVQPAIQPFKPPQQFQLTLPAELHRSQTSAPPIQKFIPLPESSEFHSKLKAIAQALVMENAEAASRAIKAANQAKPTEILPDAAVNLATASPEHEPTEPEKTQSEDS